MDWKLNARSFWILLGGCALLASSGCGWMTGLATLLIIESSGSSDSKDSPAPPPPAPLQLESKPFLLLDAEPLDIALGDFIPDARGNMDAAVAIRNSQEVSFFQGDGTGRLSRPAEPEPARMLDVPLGGVPVKIAALCTGGEGPDGLLAVTASTLELVLWDGAASRLSTSPAYLGGQPDDTRDIVDGDFDGDGSPEVAVSSASNNWVEIFDVPLGGGPMGVIRLPADVSSPVSLSAADFSPGFPASDLAVLARSGIHSVLLLYFFEGPGAMPSVPSVGPFRFTTPSRYLARGGEYNLDGDTLEIGSNPLPVPDMAVIRDDGTSSVFLRPPTGDRET